MAAPMRHDNKLEVLEQCRISPHPAGSPGRPSSLPLTFFDLIFYHFPPVQRLFFYRLTDLDDELPRLKRSLSLALRYYFPLAGRLVLSEARNPQLLCTDADFVSLTVAASRDDYHDLSGDHPRDIARFHPLVPPLLAAGERKPVFAVQITSFPNAGICMGTSVHHAVADGSTYANFMKLWSSIHRLGDVPAASAGPLVAFLDRSVVPDPAGLLSIFLEDLRSLRGDPSLDAWDLKGVPGVKIATFVYGRDALDELKRRATRSRRTTAEASPYALVCGHVWAAVVRARGDTSEKKAHFGFVTGCRARTRPLLPPNYFGNCLGICRVEAERSKLVREDGAAVAADEIWKVIRSLDKGAFRGAERWIRDVHEYASKRALTVAGSPKLGVYEVDFGWGPPRKVELVSIERTGALSLTESRAGKGGIEVGLALPSHEMEKVASYLVIDGRLMTDGLQSGFLEDVRSLTGYPSLGALDLTGVPDVKLATFVFGRDEVEKLRRRATSTREELVRASSFALASGYVWAALVRARGDTVSIQE